MEFWLYMNWVILETVFLIKIHKSNPSVSSDHILKVENIFTDISFVVSAEGIILLSGWEISRLGNILPIYTR